MKTCGKSGRQGSPQFGSSDQHGTGPGGRNTVRNHIRITIRPEILQIFIFIDVNPVNAVLQKPPGICLRTFPACNHTVYLISGLFRQLACFPDQFKYHGMNFLLLLFCKNQKILPLLFIHFIGLLLEMYGFFRTLAHTQAAHAAGIPHGNALLFNLQRSEGTDVHTLTAKRTDVFVKR